jgi:hypothetical protein
VAETTWFGGIVSDVEVPCACPVSGDALERVDEGFGSTITVRVEVAVLPQVSVAT